MEKLSKIEMSFERNMTSVSRELIRYCTFIRDIPGYYPNMAQKNDLLSSSRHPGIFRSKVLLDHIDKNMEKAIAS